jgi:predicted regulator of Ras-like GTPase activity (Roadblock/LC7/MglB family)
MAEAADLRFPDNINWTQYDRIASIQRQLDDVLAAVQVEEGLLESNDHGHQDPDHRIAALIADVLILGEMREADIEGELVKVLHWFKKK